MQQHISTPRLEVVDALRGFAVMAILLIHNVEHFIFTVYPAPTDMPDWLNIVDSGVFSVIFSLFAGKAYAIFALLFGFTFYVQYSNRKDKGSDFGPRFLWRLVLLAGFATLNAAFFPGGDVLLLFSVVGVVLFLVRKWSSRAVLITSILFLIQPLEWYHYLCSLVLESYTLPNLGVGAMYDTISVSTKSGNFWDFILTNITTGQKASLLWAVGAGRLMQTAGLFLLGLYLSRKKLFVWSKENNIAWIKILIVSSLLFCPLYGLQTQLAASDAPEITKQTVVTVLDMWQKLAFTLVIVSSFVLLYNTERFRKVTSNLRFYGKMSLTNYITQSIIGAIIYFPIGLYLAPYCGYAVSLLVGVVVFFLQLYFCKWWLKTHKQGPLEAVWYKLTWAFSASNSK